jgi:hypothetical protein
MSELVRVYAVVNWRKQRIHGMTCDVNQSAAWVRGMCDKYGDELAATQCVDLVNPAEQAIPYPGRS